MERTLLKHLCLSLGIGFLILMSGCAKDPCEDVDCGINGTTQESADGETCDCECEPGFTGEFCAQAVDPCTDISCGEHGTAVASADNLSCNCECEPGFEGDLCDIESREQFIGVYQATEDCFTGEYTVTVSKAPSGSNLIQLENLGYYACPESYAVIAAVDGNEVTISQQQFCQDEYEINGTGILTGNQLIIEYTASYESNGTVVKDVCTATLTLQ